MSQDPDIRIGVAGALGRMGRAVAAAVDARPGLNLCALFDHMGAEGSLVDGRALVSRDQALLDCEVLIDFTVGSASAPM